MTAKLCIITICFENPDDLDRTCRSVSSIVGPLVEHLIVDGSRDQRCQQVVERYPNTRYLGGRDRGKYDAMNKGVAATEALAVLFINSGDELAAPIKFLAFVEASSASFKNKIIYGDCIKRLGLRLFYQPAPTIHTAGLRVGVLPSHQSIVIPRAYQAQHPYDVELHFAADTKFLKKAFKELEVVKLNFPIGIFEYGGISSAAGSLLSICRQYKELKLVHELTPLESAATAFLLVRRKIANTLFGSDALLNAQARRLAKTCKIYSAM